MSFERSLLFLLIFMSSILGFSSSSTLSIAEKNTSTEIKQIHTLSEISTEQPPHTLFLFDLDDTIFDSISMLGSQAWRRYIVPATKKIDSTKNWHDILSYFLAQKYPLKTVEELTLPFIKELQNKGHVVCGFTARERNFWYATSQQGVDILTLRQLLSLGIDFDNGSLESIYPELATHAEYYRGVFFANTETKGEFLLPLLTMTTCPPKKIIFIDDKLSQVESVAQALTTLGISHECYLYSATVPKTKIFQPLIANIQLYYFCNSEGAVIVSDQEAEFLAKYYPKKDADFYLQGALEIMDRKI